MISRYKTGKHFSLTITDTSLAIKRRQDRIGAEAALDGFYVLRTPVPASQLDGPAVVAAYKNLTRVERDLRSIKSGDLDLRPVCCRLEERVRAYVPICMLAPLPHPAPPQGVAIYLNNRRRIAGSRARAGSEIVILRCAREPATGVASLSHRGGTAWQILTAGARCWILTRTPR